MAGSSFMSMLVDISGVQEHDQPSDMLNRYGGYAG